MQIQLQQLLGIWKLLYINSTDPARKDFYGPNLVGRIIITPESYFNAMITDKPQLPPGTVWSNATDAQKGAIARKMTVYEGPLTIFEQGNVTLTHVTVEVALNTEWVHSLQVRQALLEEKEGKEILTLIPWSVS
jgi:Lipocalin-like domain